MDGEYVEVDGTRTYYLVLGEGPTVVLLHGYALGVDAYNTWFRTIEGLSQRFRVVTFDQIGTGRTDLPTDGLYKTRIERVEHALGFLRVMGISNACLVGHSEGAFMGARMAIVQPGLASSLVLVTSGGTAPNLGGDADAEWIAANEARYNATGQFDDEESFIRQSAGLRLADDPVYIAALREGYRRAKETGSINLFASQPASETDYVEREKLQQTYVLPFLKELGIPMLLVWTLNDPGVVVARARKLLTFMPGAELHLFANSSHNVMHDRAEDFNRLLCAWCGGRQ